MLAQLKPGRSGRPATRGTGVENCTIPTFGRFLQVDPIGYDGQTNLYAYAAADPVNKTDPTGLYVCNGDDKGKQCKKIESALATIARAASRLREGSKGQQALQSVLKFYGKAGEQNGVVVGFSSKGFAGTQKVGNEIRITFNLKAMEKTFSSGALGSSKQAEFAGSVAHEGQHGSDIRALGRNPQTYEEVLRAERNGYRTQSYVNQGLRSPSIYGIWYPGLSEAGRNAAIELRAKASAEEACEDVGGCP